ncbi:hypothetical protein GS399_09100 [Pedobacter sp. HMF7647]|uniref:Uncharacterized protein n=1 Tax=Hufsiella arboris TaxID=2695275 RepID=A0A7K1Y954_9SPHI|nr:hypothetical protein [Hufsiella arboris]MXV51124.1 hypothetical protein [Hufsiella arboris]
MKPKHLALLSLIITFKIQAQSLPQKSGSYSKSAQNRAYFLSLYGKDDSSKAVINMFFNYRKGAEIGVITSSAMAVAGSVAISTSGGGDPGGSQLETQMLAAPVVLGSVLTLAAFSFTLSTYSRKRLLNILNDYEAGKALPKYIRWKKNFKKELTKLKPIFI